MDKREHLGSRLSFILLSAGCAIGIGNVWKFPYMVGQNGGAAFVLIYLLFLVLLGVPVMTMEFAMGRAAQKSPIHMYQQLEPKKSKWHIHGWFALLGNILLMMFYTNVSGWMLQYFVKSAAGDFAGLDAVGVGAQFTDMLADPVMQIVYMGIIVLIGLVVCSFSLNNGLERITKWMMIALLVIMVILAVNSVVNPAGKEGLEFYLVPDFGKLSASVIVAAMNQSFFTLSLGIGAMAIFGSYLDKKRSLMGEAVNVAILDTFVAFTAGLIIFPAGFAYGVDVTTAYGPSLIFVTLPNIFNNMPLGQLWGSLFFVFMTFAALSTVLAEFENIIACLCDLTKFSRKKSAIITGIGIFILSLPCVFGYNLWSGFKPFGEGTAVLDLEDFLVSNILLPIGALIIILFCVIPRYGWGWKNFVKEANEGKGLKIKNWMRWYMTIVIPLIVLAIFIIGLVQFQYVR